MTSFRTTGVALVTAFAALACTVQNDSGDEAGAGSSNAGSGGAGTTGGAGSGGSSPGGSAGSGGGSSGSETSSCDTVDGRFVITDDTNYTLPSSLELDLVTLKDATDLVFDWGGLTQDFYGRPLDPREDIDMILLSLWKMTPEELRSRLERDDLPRSENVGAITAYPDGSGTSRNLLSFDLQGNPIPEEELWGYFDTQAENFAFPQDQYTYLAMASTGTVIGRGARMLKFFKLDPGSSETTLTFEDDSTRLDFEANLAGARPMRVPAATPGITIDWEEMMLTSLGNEFLPQQITRAAVAHYASGSLADLENDFVNLEEIADGWWETEVTRGTSIELSSFADESGATFPGIDARGTWLVALFCTAICNNPAPWSITILKPCE